MEDNNSAVAVAAELCSTSDNKVYICQDCGQAFCSFPKLMAHNLLMHIDDTECFVEMSDASRHTSFKFCSDIGSYFQHEFNSQLLLAETQPDTTNVHYAKVEDFTDSTQLLNPKTEEVYLQAPDESPLKASLPKRFSARLRKKNGCLFCGRCFASSYSLKVHLRVHSGEKPYVCQHCGFRFTQKGNLATHLRIGACLKATKETTANEMKIMDVKGSYEHEDSSANSVENFDVNGVKQKQSSAVLACKTCGEKFRSNGLLVVHERTHSRERPFKCHFCGFGFTQKSNCEKHIRSGICQRSKDKSACTKTAVKLCETRESGPENCEGLLNPDKITQAPEANSENDATFDDENIHHQLLSKVSVSAHGEKLKLPLPVAEICATGVRDSSQTFDCKNCGRRFQRNCALLQHERIHLNSKPFVCSKCGTRFRQNSHLHRHEQSCGQHFQQNISLLEPEQIYLNMKPFVCSKCGARFRQNCHLHRHERSCGCPKQNSDKFKQPKKILPDEITDYASILRQKAGLELRDGNMVAESSSNGLDGSLVKEITDNETVVLLNDISPPGSDAKCRYSHKAKSPTNNGPYICSLCDKPFTRNRSLRAHMRLHSGEKPYSCHFCGESFPLYRNLQSHIFHHHKLDTGSNFLSKPGRPVKGVGNPISQQGITASTESHAGLSGGTPRFFCQPCQRPFSKKECLDNHMRTHTGERPFVCSVCARAFATRQTLSIHSRMHTGELPYMCSFCARRFRQMSNLLKHVRAVHVRERKHACSQCSQRFREPEHLKKHVRSVHSDERPYICHVCGKGFALSNNLKLHVQLHLGLKPHACPTCGKCFTQRKHLLRHEQTHLEVKRFKCEVCGKQFGDAYYFRKHKQQHDTVLYECEHCGLTFSRRCHYAQHVRMHDSDDPRGRTGGKVAQPEGFNESYGLGVKRDEDIFVGVEVTVDDIGETC